MPGGRRKRRSSATSISSQFERRLPTEGCGGGAPLLVAPPTQRAPTGTNGDQRGPTGTNGRGYRCCLFPLAPPTSALRPSLSHPSDPTPIEHVPRASANQRSVCTHVCPNRGTSFSSIFSTLIQLATDAPPSFSAPLLPLTVSFTEKKIKDKEIDDGCTSAHHFFFVCMYLCVCGFYLI